MSKDITYRQCKLNRDSDSGTYEYVAWIPSKFAEEGKNVVINDVEWRVVFASSVEMDADFIHSIHNLKKWFPSIDSK